MSLDEPSERVSATREETESRDDTTYPGPSRIHLAAFPPKERWDDWTELDSQSVAALQRAFVREAPYSMLDYDSSCHLVDVRV